MEKMTYSSVKNIVIEKVRKNLFIRPWEKDEVEIKFSKGDNTDINYEGDSLEITSEKSLLLSVPVDAILSIENVGGNCVLYGNLGVLNIERVGGNLEITKADTVNVDFVGGNCVVGPVQSGLNIGRVGGNLHVENSPAGYMVEKVGGNLSAFGMLSDFSCSVGGSAKINCSDLVGSEVYIRAGGNIKMNIRENSDFDLVAKSGGFANIKVGTLEVKGVTKRVEERVGQGGKQLTLKAGGNIKLSEKEPEDIAHFEEKPFDQAAWDSLEEKVEKNDVMDYSFNFSNLFNLEKEINEDVQEKIKFAEERIKSAMENLDLKYNIHPHGHSSGTSFEYDIRPKQEKQNNPVSDEERMMILKMLQEKKISAEEADRLLSVLEQS